LFHGEPKATAFIGDGINDAPALARAAVGVAVASGSDLAAEAGDIVLMGEPLRPLPLLVRLSRQTVHIIRQNIYVFAFGANFVGIALTGWLWPLFARSPEWFERAPLAGVIYHQLGSLAVLLNSMRLLAFERRPSGAGWERARRLFTRADRVVERLTDLDGLIHDLSHHWKKLAAGLVAIAGLAWLASGLVAIGPDEVGVARRFGRLLPELLQPGLNVRWPWPIERVDRIQPERVRTVDVGFRTVEPMRTAKAGVVGWASGHGGEGLVRRPEEAVLATGDGDLVEMLAVVRFR